MTKSVSVPLDLIIGQCLYHGAIIAASAHLHNGFHETGIE